MPRGEHLRKSAVPRARAQDDGLGAARPRRTMQQKAAKQRKTCAAACAEAASAGQLRERGALVHLDCDGRHIMCWPCAQNLTMAFAIRHKVAYVCCPLCRQEVRSFRRVRDGVRAHDVLEPVGALAARLEQQEKLQRAAAAKAAMVARAHAEASAAAAAERAMREAVEVELRTELASTHELARLGMCLWRAAHGGKRPRAGARFRTDGNWYNHRMLCVFSDEFPVVARLCDTERAQSDVDRTKAVLARRTVFDWLDGVGL
jgi:hypothetical protein